MNKTENLGLNKPTMTDFVSNSVEKVFGENFDIIDEKISDIDEDISELSENLNDKADKEHSHSQYATAADLESGLAGKADSSHTHSDLAPKASPAFTGTPKAPTAASGTNTTQIATTEFVQNNIEKNQIVFGVYTGNSSTFDPSSYRSFDLGFEPIAVEVFHRTGIGGTTTVSGGTRDVHGGLALKGYPLYIDSSIGVRITSAGFEVLGRSLLNWDNNTYYYKAYKSGTINE